MSKVKKTSRTESTDYIYNNVHDLIEAIYKGIPTQKERAKILGPEGYEAFCDLDYWLGHA